MNANGECTRATNIQWVGLVKQIQLMGSHLIIAVGDELIEVWDTRTSQLIQRIQGECFRLYSQLENFNYWAEALISMKNPLFPDRQALLILNREAKVREKS